MVTKTQAIKAYLMASTHDDLAAMYNHDMECQVNVAQDHGERVKGEYKGVKWSGYTDGTSTWKAFRIPYHANSDPVYEDTQLKFDLSIHAEGIGMTGWDWKSRVSKWVAFDFDAITGHSERHTSKIDTEDMKRIRDVACEIPWVTVRYSTGGRGLHLYVMLDAIPTANHTEHAALARSILAKMSALSGYDYTSKVDICGGNMWVWHRKMIDNHQGLRLIKPGVVLRDVPSNWRDHLDVVRGVRAKVRQKFNLEDTQNKFDQTAGQRNHIPLDQDHLLVVKWLNDNSKKEWWWDADHHMLVTHTMDLKSAHDDLSLRGIFETESRGTSEQNCFMFPLRRGAWSVRRYSLGCSEHPSWEQDGQLWTKCYYNQEPNLRTASMAHGGLEDPSGGYSFQSGVEAIDAAARLGATVNIPPGLQGRSILLKPHKDGRRLVVEMPAESHDNPKDMVGWLKKGNKWLHIYNARLNSESEISNEDIDDFVRHVITPEHEDAGWLIKADDVWHREPLTHIKMALKSISYKGNEIEMLIGSSVFKPWKQVVYPFQPEYPGDRQWNRMAPQLRHIPSSSDELSYPHWMLILKHIGSGLDLAVRDEPWCVANGIISGADYLKCWIACMFQYAFDPLPYLFLYSEKQATGKSILHEALNLLFKPGYKRADKALTVDFNAELEGAILCVIEEIDLSASPQAYNRIKDWVTSPILPIHRKMMTPYEVPNTTHWIQCSNSKTACPVFQNDTRITVVNVPDLPSSPISKGRLLQLLDKEAPDFLAEILRLEVPECGDRLRIPVISTQAKMDVSKANRSLVEVFIEEQCHEAPGYMVTLADFYKAFVAWIDPSERFLWSTKQKVSAAMPDRYPKGRCPQTAQWCWGNISLEPQTEPRPKLTAHKDKLIWSE